MSEGIKPHGIAVFIVLVVHALLAWVLLHVATPRPGHDNAPLQLRWRLRPLVDDATPRKPTSTSSLPASGRARAAPAALAEGTPVSADAHTGPTNAPPSPEPAPDFLAQAAAWARDSSPASGYDTDPLRRRQVRLPGGPAGQPERFAMREPLSPQQVIRSIGVLFAGPGYTTDPCPRIRRNADNLLTDTRDPGRRRLAWELQQYEDHCQ